jgi:hypothetical protein
MMKPFVFCLISVMLGTAVAWGRQPNEQRGPTELDNGAEVLTRGPIHEAFAGTVAFDPEPGIVVPKAPAAIEELPPQYKPVGANVEWIPGYWAWDDSNDFLWISGIWRNLPPGRQWVPGYWSRSGDGAQWTSGYWADAEARELDYLPEPPESVESGSNIEAPSADYIWLPGCWVWQQNRYAWRPGFWTPAYENWVWTSAHYQWTPRGYTFVDGYWDHAVSRRGLLFAPVRFDQSVYSRRGFSYTPSTVIRIGELASYLFLRPNYGHYYYGDYYGTNYTSAGFFPSYSFHSSRRGYDPIYSHQRWQHRQDGDWERSVHEHFQYRRDHEDARPPRTFSAQQELLKSGQTEQDQGRIFAQPLDEFTKTQDSPLPFQSLNDEDRLGFGRRGQEVRAFREQRQKLEARSIDPAAEQPAGTREPARIRFPKSPLVGKAGDKLGKDVAPPKTHAFPQPDPKVVPKPRENRRSPGAIGNPKVTTPQPGDGTGGKSPGKANNKPRRNPQGKSAGKPTNVPTAPHGGANEKPKVEQPKPKEEPKPQPQGESKDKS